MFTLAFQQLQPFPPHPQSDLYAVGRMMYDMLAPHTTAGFPTSSPAQPHYNDADIPELPDALSPGFRGVLRSLVLDDVAARPTAAEAYRCLCALLFGGVEESELLGRTLVDAASRGGRRATVFEEERAAYIAGSSGVGFLAADTDLAMGVAGPRAGAGEE